MNIPDDLPLHPQLTPLCVYFYTKLKRLANGKKSISISYHQFGITRTQGVKYSRLLEQYGFIKVFHDVVGRGKVNTYKFLR